MTKKTLTAFLVVTLGIAVGCSPLFSNLEVTDLKKNESSVKGIKQFSDSKTGDNKTRRILVIHGMTHKLNPGYSFELISKIAEGLNIDSAHDKSDDCELSKEICTTTFSYNNGTLVVYEILYANVHKLRQAQLDLVMQDEKVVDSPAGINRWAKHKLMIHRFGDAIAYHVGDSCRNSFRDQLQNEVKKILLGIEKEIKSNRDLEMYIVSHSLGSNVVLDVMRKNSTKFGENLKGVYLLANQYALIELAFEEPIYENILEDISTRYKTHIAAFSDRDDILSYALDLDSCETCVNAVLNVGKDFIPFVLADPDSAHNGYWGNGQVATCIVQGCGANPKR